MTTTLSPTVPAASSCQDELEAASAKLEAHMTSEYTPIWAAADFLLDAASVVSADPLAVAEVHALLTELAPSAQRTVVLTSDATEIVAKVRRIAGLS